MWFCLVASNFLPVAHRFVEFAACYFEQKPGRTAACLRLAQTKIWGMAANQSLVDDG